MGIDIQEVKRLINTVPPKSKYVPGLDAKVIIHNSEAPSKSYMPGFGFYPPITDYDLSTIPLGKIRVVNSDNMSETLGEYDNAKRAVEGMDCSHGKPRRYINKQFRFTTNANADYPNNFYLLKNPATSPRNEHKIQLYQSLPGTNDKHPVETFNSVADVLRYFDLNPNSHNWYNRYVKTGKPYNKNGKVWFIEDFSDSESE